MIDNGGVVMPRGLNLWIIPEMMIGGIKSGAKKKKKGILENPVIWDCQSAQLKALPM